MYKIKNKQIIETDNTDVLEKQFKKRNLEKEYDIYERIKDYILYNILFTIIFIGFAILAFCNSPSIKNIIIYTILITTPIIFITNYIDIIITYRAALITAVKEQKTTFFCTEIQKKHTKYYITILGRPICEIKSRQNIETCHKRCHFFPIQDLKIISHKKQPVE